MFAYEVVSCVQMHVVRGCECWTNEQPKVVDTGEPSARERPVRGFIPPRILSLFGYRLRIGHHGEIGGIGVAVLGFLFGTAFCQ